MAMLGLHTANAATAASAAYAKSCSRRAPMRN